MTSPPARTGMRGNRGAARTLVVDASSTNDLRSAPDDVIFARSTLDAVGAIATMEAGAVRRVVVRSSALEPGANRVAGAIKRIDPAVETVLALESVPGQPSQPALHDPEFDSTASWSDIAHELRLPLAPAPRAASSPGESASKSRTEHSSRVVMDVRSTPPPPLHTAAQPRANRTATDDMTAIPSPASLSAAAYAARPVANMPAGALLAAPLVPTSAQSASTQAAPTEPLGDTDLVEAILLASDGVKATALKLIVQQTGWKDVRMLDDVEPAPAPASPEGMASADVVWREAHFGKLVSAQASAKQLRAWADWLAHWLSLDRTMREHRLLSYRDDLTGAWNRRFYDARMPLVLAQAAQVRRPVTVMVFDLDNFKPYNDSYGHEAGDQILKDVVAALASMIRKGDWVCRIGGDEFAVVFADPEGPRAAGSSHPSDVEGVATRFQQAVCKLKCPMDNQHSGTDLRATPLPAPLSVSTGLATYPWDGVVAAGLLRVADHRALESKRRGKNSITGG